MEDPGRGRERGGGERRAAALQRSSQEPSFVWCVLTVVSGLTLAATWKAAEKFGAAWSQADILGRGAVLERACAVIHMGWWVKSAVRHRRAPVPVTPSLTYT